MSDLNCEELLKLPSRVDGGLDWFLCTRPPGHVGMHETGLVSIGESRGLNDGVPANMAIMWMRAR